MPRPAVCSSKVSSTPLSTTGSPTAGTGERYLEYAAHGGFNNQRRNLFHALLMAHALNRTLLLPPALSHRLSPHYGQCPSHVAPPDATLKRFEAAAAHQEAIAAKRERRKAPGPLASASLSRLLDLSNVTDLVRVADLARYDTSQASATVKYDCSNTIWTFQSLTPKPLKKECRARDGWRSRGGCACRDVRKTLKNVDFPLLRVGSTFKGFDTDPVRYRPDVLRLQRATLTYAAPFLAVTRAAVRSFAPSLAKHSTGETFDYAALHLRGGDGEFKRRFSQTVGRGMKDLLAQYEAARKRRVGPQHLPVTLYVASDVAFKKHRAFRDGLGALEAAARAHAGGGDRGAPAVRVVALRDVVKDAYVALAAATPGLEDGRALAALPDVEMHLDLLLCARARLAFAGTAGSSVSSSIRTLRRFLLDDDARAARGR